MISLLWISFYSGIGVLLFLFAQNELLTDFIHNGQLYKATSQPLRLYASMLCFSWSANMAMKKISEFIDQYDVSKKLITKLMPVSILIAFVYMVLCLVSINNETISREGLLMALVITGIATFLIISFCEGVQEKRSRAKQFITILFLICTSSIALILNLTQV